MCFTNHVLLLTFWWVWIVPMTVFSLNRQGLRMYFCLNLSIFPMDDKLSPLVLADLAPGIDGILLFVKVAATAGRSVFLNITAAIGVGDYMM